MIYYGKPFLQYCKKNEVDPLKEYFILYSIYYNKDLMKETFTEFPVKELHSLQRRGFIAGVNFPDRAEIQGLTLTEKGEDFLLEYHDSYDVKRANDWTYNEEKYDTDHLLETEKEWTEVFNMYPGHNGAGRTLKTKKKESFLLYLEARKEDSKEDILAGMRNYVTYIKRHNKMEYIQGFYAFLRDKTFLLFKDEKGISDWIDDI